MTVSADPFIARSPGDTGAGKVHASRRHKEIMTIARLPEKAPGAFCPVCTETAVFRFRLEPYSVFDCPVCHHRFSPDALRDNHVQSVYSDDYFFGGGDGYDDYLREAKLLRAQGRRYGDLLSEHVAPGRVLDVGSAAGFLLAGLQDAKWTVTGLEPNAAMATYARDTLGLDTVQGSLEDSPDLPTFDAVCLIQVIGHFYDLGRALSATSRLTRMGGLCLVEYWRRDSLVARLLGRRWHEYSPPSVLHWFTRDSLNTAMRLYGFTPVDQGAPRKYISGGHARSLLAHKLRQAPLGNVLAAPTALIPRDVNFRYPALDLEWHLYRRDHIVPEVKRTADISGDPR
jgi:SAM-dependent methyltransferase